MIDNLLSSSLRENSSLSKNRNLGTRQGCEVIENYGNNSNVLEHVE